MKNGKVKREKTVWGNPKPLWPKGTPGVRCAKCHEIPQLSTDYCGGLKEVYVKDFMPIKVAKKIFLAREFDRNLRPLKTKKWKELRIGKKIIKECKELGVDILK